MIVEHFAEDKIALTQLRDALSIFHRINFFAVLLDVAANRSLVQQAITTDTAALQNAWHNGYVEAINDIFYFLDRYTPKEKREDTQMDFGAIEALLKAGDITETEADELRNARG